AVAGNRKPVVQRHQQELTQGIGLQLPREESFRRRLEAVPSPLERPEVSLLRVTGVPPIPAESFPLANAIQPGQELDFSPPAVEQLLEPRIGVRDLPGLLRPNAEVE